MRRGLVVLSLTLVSACALFAPRPAKSVVFFNERSSALDDAAGRVIDQAASSARAAQVTRVQLVGYTDRFGAPKADIELSRERVEAVAARLVADGVPEGRLVLDARGPALNSNPGVESRRVEIDVW